MRHGRHLQRPAEWSALIRIATLLFVAIMAMQSLYAAGIVPFGFGNWRRSSRFRDLGRSALRRKYPAKRKRRRALFVLPAVLFTLALVIFRPLRPLHRAHGLEPVLGTPAVPVLPTSINSSPIPTSECSATWCSMWTVVVQYAIAFARAVLNAEIRGRKFFRVAFLCPSC
jgi:multiple sugar transport system permease protein